MFIDCLTLLQFVLILIGATSRVTGQEYPFITEPENLTVNFGEFVEFECRVHSIHHTELELFIGKTLNGSRSSQIFPRFDQSSALRDIEFSANITNSTRNESVGKAWIIMNSRTLQLVEYFYCKVFGSGFIVRRSRNAYISIVFPECTPIPYQLTIPPGDLDLSHSMIEPTSSQTFIMHQSVMTKSAIQEPCRRGDHNFSYKVAIGITCACIAVLVLVIIVILCICISKRKQLMPVVKCTNNIGNNMVPNPIYDGPLYESVQPQLESRVSGVAAARNTLTDNLRDEEELSSSMDNITEKSRYVSQPGLIQSGSFSVNMHSNDHLSKNSQQLQDDSECSESACNGTNRLDGMMLQNREDAYTVMNPAGTLTHSAFSDGWTEQNP